MGDNIIAFTPSSADDDCIQPFQLVSSNIRGRVIRLGGTLDDILEAHNYPGPVNQLLGETVTLSLLLSSMLKFDGIFTLQTKGDGPVSMLISDVVTPATVRGYASYDEEKLQAYIEQRKESKPDQGVVPENADNWLARILGSGYIAFTVDQKRNVEDRYQGIVELKGRSMLECVQHYIQQSDQIDTCIKMAFGKRGDQWRCGAVMIQHMPEDNIERDNLTDNDEEDWNRSIQLLNTCRDEELLAPELHSHELLHRLFHEEGVKVFDPVPVSMKCRCEEDRIVNVLKSLPYNELEDHADDGVIEMRCEFCSKSYNFDIDDFKPSTEC